MLIYEIENIDGIVKEFTTDREFIEYAKLVFNENEEPDTYLSEPDTVQDAEQYINTYCTDLTLTIY